MVSMLILGGCETAAVDAPTLRGQAALRDKTGQQVGLATLTEGVDGVRIEITGVGLPRGSKGLHVHAVAKCDPSDFLSTGAHFHPAGKKHGPLNPDGAHPQPDDEKTDPTGNSGARITCGVITRT